MAIKGKTPEVPADLANLNGDDDAPPKMEMAALPPEAAAAPMQMLTTNVPGTIAPAAMVLSSAFCGSSILGVTNPA